MMSLGLGFSVKKIVNSTTCVKFEIIGDGIFIFKLFPLKVRVYVSLDSGFISKLNGLI